MNLASLIPKSALNQVGLGDTLGDTQGSSQGASLPLSSLLALMSLPPLPPLLLFFLSIYLFLVFSGQWFSVYPSCAETHSVDHDGL